jgi:hypothetical protein
VVRAKKKFMRLLLLSVSGLGLCSTAFLLADPPPADPSNIDYDSATTSIFAQNSRALLSNKLLSRDPSSVAPQTEQKIETVFDFNCSDSNIFDTSLPRFRVKGNSCVDELSKGEVVNATQILNQSNGYVATVFHRTPESFTTDYINLSEGTNKIKFVFEFENSRVEKILTVNRAPASTKK